MQQATKNKKLISAVKLAVEPYLFAWNDWSNEEACLLTTTEIKIINTLIINSFEADVLKDAGLRFPHKSLKLIPAKLNSGSEAFKDWVIFKFLHRVIDLAKRQGSKNVLDQRVNTLPLPVEIIAHLKKFRITCIRDLGILYKEEDFKTQWMYDLVTEFYRIS